jgi:hypothetical protein
MDEAPDSIRGVVPVRLPLLQHALGIRQTMADDGVQNLVLGFEVVVEVAARYLHDIGDVRERGMFVTAVIEQLISRFDNLIAGCPIAHENSFQRRQLAKLGGPRLGRASDNGLGRSSKSVKIPYCAG